MKNYFRRTFLLVSSAVLVLPGLWPVPVLADGTVTNCTEASLRTALADGGTVTIACDGIITLTTPLGIATNTTLDASGHTVVIDGNRTTRVFTVQTNVVCTMLGLTVANGRGVAEGAGIHNAGTLTLRQCTLSNNVAFDFRGAGLGGGIWNNGTLNVFGCTFASNQAAGGAGLGGGIWNNGTLNVFDCTFTSNQAPGNFDGSGGAIANYRILQVASCTFVQNSSRNNGGAIFTEGSQGGQANLTNCTFYGNNTGFTSGTTALHAVYPDGVRRVFVINCTLSKNGSGSAIASSFSNSTIFVANCIVDGGGPLAADGVNNVLAISTNTIDVHLGPLTDYGGPTPTMALLEGSPAIDSADAALCPPTDQRGVARPYGVGCDIGAFESAPPYTILGRISGYVDSPEHATVIAGTAVGSVDRDGTYALHGLTGGTYRVTPMASDAVFVLSNRVISVGPDIVALNFHSWRSNAFTFDRLAGPQLRFIFAGHTGDTWRVLQSTDLPGNWTLHSTHTVESSGLFEFSATNDLVSPTRFFRAETP